MEVGGHITLLAGSNDQHKTTYILLLFFFLFPLNYTNFILIRVSYELWLSRESIYMKKKKWHWWNEKRILKQIAYFLWAYLILAKIEGAHTNADLWSIIKILIAEDEDGVCITVAELKNWFLKARMYSWVSRREKHIPKLDFLRIL